MPRAQMRMRGAKHLVLGAIVSSAVAIGFGSPADASQAPKYSDLVAGRLTAPPIQRDRPASIPASESVTGFFVSAPASNNPSASQMVIVTSDPHSVAAPSPPSTVESIHGCFAQLNPVITSTTDEWDGAQSWQTNIWTTPGPRTPVAIHHEIVAEQNGKTSLESTDVWLDPLSHGMRLISKASMPLKQIGTAPGGVRFFVGRDDRADGKHFVHLVATRSKDTPFQDVQTATASRSDGFMGSGGACSHHRVSLQAPTKTDGGAQTAVLQFNTMLPDLAPGELSPAPSLPINTTPNVHDVRTRSIRASFSLSQTSRDKEPVVSVATTWAAGEMNQRIFTPSAPTPPPIKPMRNDVVGAVGTVGTVRRVPPKPPGARLDDVF